MIESFEKIIDPNFISAELIGGVGSFKVVTIKDIAYLDAFNSRTNTTEKKQSLVFEEGKPLVLNKTNAKTLKQLFSPNEDKPENCIGKEIELYVIATKVGGKATTGIRIREHSATKCDRCGQVIKPTATVPVTQIVAISQKNFKKNICLDCMKKIKEE